MNKTSNVHSLLQGGVLQCPEPCFQCDLCLPNSRHEKGEDPAGDHPSRPISTLGTGCGTPSRPCSPVCRCGSWATRAQSIRNGQLVVTWNCFSSHMLGWALFQYELGGALHKVDVLSLSLFFSKCLLPGAEFSPWMLRSSAWASSGSW